MRALHYRGSVQVFGDAYFVAPLYQFLELYARTGGRIYTYSFTERGPDIFGNVVTFQGRPLCSCGKRQ